VLGTPLYRYCGVQEHKSGNISETRKDRGKVAYRNSSTLFRTVPSPTAYDNSLPEDCALQPHPKLQSITIRPISGAGKGRHDGSISVFTARCTSVQSAVLRSHVVRLSVRPSVTLVDQDHIGRKSWKLIARTLSPTHSLFGAQRSSTYSQGNMGKFWGD